MANENDPMADVMGSSGNIIILSREAKQELMRKAEARDAARSNSNNNEQVQASSQSRMSNCPITT